MNTNNIRILVNGDRHEVAQGSPISRLLETLEIDPRTIAIEHNGEIVRRDAFGTTTLRDGDRLEVVRFVQGG